jgi:hypothetical protein
MIKNGPSSIVNIKIAQDVNGLDIASLEGNIVHQQPP